MARIQKIAQVVLPVFAGYVLHGLIDVLYIDVESILNEFRTDILRQDQFYSNLEHQLDEISSKTQNYIQSNVPEITGSDFQTQKQLDKSESLKQLLESPQYQPPIPAKYTPKNEYEVTKWDLIFNNNVYGVDIMELGEPRIGLVGKYRFEVNALAHHLNLNPRDFHNIYRREDVSRGIDYKIMLKNSEKIEITKPFIQDYFRIENRSKISTQTVINLICPVSKVAERLELFLTRYVENKFEAVNLILVSMSETASKSREVTKLTEAYNAKLLMQNRASITVLEVDEPFNRGRALNLGANTLNRLSLIYFIDVDLTVNQDALDRCRLNASPEKSVFFPIVFNQYNPEIIKTGNPPGRDPVQNLMSINKWTGFWIHYGYGMICLYQGDFENIGKFPEISGWGGEDVGIYRNFLKNSFDKVSDLEVIQGVEPGLIHVYHDRKCDRDSLTNEQYRMCVGATSETIGNRQQMATVYLKNLGLL